MDDPQTTSHGPPRSTCIRFIPSSFSSIMSTLSLPSCTPDHNYSPTYSTESQQYERRLVPPRQRLSSKFVKQSRSGELSLRLAAQVDGVTTPMYALRELVEGTVEIAKPDGLAYVAVEVRISVARGSALTVFVQVEGFMKL